MFSLRHLAVNLFLGGFTNGSKIFIKLPNIFFKLLTRIRQRKHLLLQILHLTTQLLLLLLQIINHLQLIIESAIQTKLLSSAARSCSYRSLTRAYRATTSSLVAPEQTMPE
ncbi:hypothetical protein QL285_007540 [Trifolium repens]|nr:hypothetical protein QL285_007540 [Trifolium repens]